MHICINFYGQPRNPENVRAMLDTSLIDSNHTYHILYSTWENENIELMQKLNPELNIFRYAMPDDTVFDKFNNFKLDSTQVADKTLKRHLLGLYIKEQTAKTILQYEKNKSIKFDIIVTLRADAKIQKNVLYNFYSSVDLLSNIMYVAEEPCFNIYKTGSYPDVLMFSNRETMLKALDIISIYEYCVVKNTNYFHPETSAFNILIYKNIVMFSVKLYAFTC